MIIVNLDNVASIVINDQDVTIRYPGKAVDHHAYLGDMRFIGKGASQMDAYMKEAEGE